MSSFVMLPCFLAGRSALHDLPVTLLYEITRQLDLRSQQNLFMASSQLHSKWHLQISEPDWQFFDWGLDLLSQLRHGFYLC